ncbi:MAG: tetratricopeptide repeat protein [Nitrospinae bacterium]|nr:tetratricopeptide repeat protein [Nitrospinota bacterium]
MSLIYISSSSSEAEPFSLKIASQCELFLNSAYILSKNEETISTHKIRSEIEACDVLVVVIATKTSEGSEDISPYDLIDNERVRLEIISAMNKDILIVPVLINDARLPENGNIPGGLKKLLDCKPYPLRSVFWSEDLEVLLEHLEDELGFLKEVQEKLSESVEVNYQRLAEFDGRKPQKINIESSDFMQLRKMIEAETIFLQKARGTGDRKAEKNALSALALAYSRLGQTQKAIQYFQEQLLVSQDMGDYEEVCSLLANLGDAYAVSGNIDRAKNYYEEQLTLAELKGLGVFVGSSYNGLGHVFVKKEKIQEAIDCYIKALENYRELQDHDKQLELLVGIALNYFKLEQWEKTVEFLHPALDAAKYLENRKEEIQIQIDLAESYEKLGKQDLVKSHLDKAEESLNITDENWCASLKRRIETLRV